MTLVELVPGTEADYIAHDLTPVLGSLAEIAAWHAAASQAGHRLPALLHIDTGMSRLGLDAAELAILAQDHTRLDGIDLRYVMTHLVASEAASDAINPPVRSRFFLIRSGSTSRPSTSDRVCASAPADSRKISGTAIHSISHGPVERS